MFPYVEESEPVRDGILPDEQSDAVRRILLQVTVLDIQHLVKETPDMEPESDPVFGAYLLRILSGLYPASFGKGEFELVAVELGPFRRYDRGDFRNVQMSYPYKLVVYLLLFGLKLHTVWKRLPLASSAYTEMTAERLQTVSGWLHNSQYVAFHIILALLCDLDIDYVSGYGELQEKHCPIHVGYRLAFSCD